MKRSMLCAVAVAVAALSAIALAGCAGPSAGTAASSASTSSPSGSSNPSSSEGSSSVVVVGAEDIITISLDYAAGTGFEWTCSAEPEGIVSLVNQATIDRAQGEATDEAAQGNAIAGGPLQEQFTFRAAKPGEVVLTFALARPWEDGDPAETQVYAFTVTDDLQMVLNPYKSSFVNEPEWGSNS